MRTSYTEEDIKRFFEQFKKRTSTYPLDSIVKLIDHKPLNTSTGFKLFRSYKILILMTTITALVITSYFLFINNPINKSDENLEMEQQPITVIVPAPKDSMDVSSFDQNENHEKTEIKADYKEATKTNESNRKIENKVSENLEESFQTSKISEFIPEEKKEPVSEYYCNWPKDTVLDGNSFILDLTNDELREIGFLIDETGIYYANEYQGEEVYFHSRFENRSGELTYLMEHPHSNNKKLKKSHNNFFPVYITDFLFNPIIESRSAYESFTYENDVLIPVRLNSGTLKFGLYDRIIWFTATDELFNRLPVGLQILRESYNCIKQLKVEDSQRNIVQYVRKSIIEGSKPISLSKDFLERIGLKFNPDFSLTYREFNETCGFAIKIKKEMQGVSLLHDNQDNKISKFHLLMVSDDHGKQNIQWRCEDNQYLNLYKEHDLLVPILIKQVNFPQYISKNMIFWFEPSPKLFKALPRKIGKQLKNEYDYMMADEEGRKDMDTSCTYFEACRSTLKLPELKVFPNPVNNLLNLSFFIQEQATGAISILSIDGFQMKELRKSSMFPAGPNKYSFDLSDLSDGIYILMIATNQGYLTRRIIIQK